MFVHTQMYSCSGAILPRLCMLLASELFSSAHRLQWTFLSGRHLMLSMTSSSLNHNFMISLYLCKQYSAIFTVTLVIPTCTTLQRCWRLPNSWLSQEHSRQEVRSKCSHLQLRFYIPSGNRYLTL